MGLFDWFMGRPANAGVDMANWEESVAKQAETQHVAKEENLQKEFAQHGVQWRAADARAAGIAPLAALGANLHSYQTTAFPGMQFDHGALGRASESLGQHLLGGLGQNILGSAMRSATQDTRTTTLQNLQLKSAELEVVNRDLQNQYLASQIRQIGSASPSLPSNSAMPLLTGQGNSTPTSPSGGYVQENPLQRIHSQPGRPSQEVGAVPDFGFARTNTGLAIVPSKDVKEKIEDQFIPEMMWAARNQLMPNFGSHPAPDPKYYSLPAGFDEWKWNHWAQEFQPARKGESFLPPFLKRR